MTSPSFDAPTPPLAAKPHPAAYPPGSILAGKYKVEEVLGAGGMGVVVAARHLQLDERVAIKLLLPEFVHNEEVVARFLREGRAAIKIHSQHVVRILDVDALETGAPYLVMECLDGQDLESAIRTEGPLAVDRAIDLLLQAGEALAEAHALGIVHRDLKPANLFLSKNRDDSECLKVLDFGISKLYKKTKGIADEARITGSAAIMGSPLYMSPEQLRSTRDVDARADIWALGAILHELVAGAPPFYGDTMPVICAQILKEEPPHLRALNEDLPAGLEAAVLHCLEKDPDARFSNVAELAVALAPFGSPAARASAERICRILHAVDVEHPAEAALEAAHAMPELVVAGVASAVSASPVIPVNVTTETSWSSQHAAHTSAPPPARKPHEKSLIARTASLLAVAAVGVVLGAAGVHSYVRTPAEASGVATTIPTLAAGTNGQPSAIGPVSTGVELTAAQMDVLPNAATADAGVGSLASLPVPPSTATATNAAAAPKAVPAVAPVSHARAHKADDADTLFDERK